MNMEAKNTDISSRRAELRQLTQGSSIKFIFKPKLACCYKIKFM